MTTRCQATARCLRLPDHDGGCIVESHNAIQARTDVELIQLRAKPRERRWCRLVEWRAEHGHDRLLWMISRTTSPGVNIVGARIGDRVLDLVHTDHEGIRLVPPALLRSGETIEVEVENPSDYERSDEIVLHLEKGAPNRVHLLAAAIRRLRNRREVLESQAMRALAELPPKRRQAVVAAVAHLPA